MKLALIPPIPNLGQFAPTGVNLLLAHLLTHRRYIQYYRMRSLAGDFNILDNGAHEDQHYEFEELLNLGHEVGAQEVVIQDKAHDREVTLDNFYGTLAWLNTLHGESVYRILGAPRLMFVPQVEAKAENLDLYLQTVNEMVIATHTQTWIKQSKFTLGIALMYECLSGGLVNVASRVANILEDTDVQVHLLGWSRNFNSPLRINQNYPSLVRSIDTAKPFVYGLHDLFISVEHNGEVQAPIYPGRPDFYFERKLVPRQAYIGNYNSAVLNALLFDPLVPYLSKLSVNMQTSSGKETVGDSSGLPDSPRVKERKSPRR